MFAEDLRRQGRRERLLERQIQELCTEKAAQARELVKLRQLSDSQTEQISRQGNQLHRDRVTFRDIGSMLREVTLQNRRLKAENQALRAKLESTGDQ